MFVTNHVLSGVMVGRALPRRPLAAFVVGVGSHLALDMVPHWGCASSAPLEDRTFLRYAQRDGLLGLMMAACATAAVHPRSRRATLAAIAGATLLDADKPMVFFFGHDPFPDLVRKVHTKVQNESPRGLPNEVAFGVCCALADVVIALSGRLRRGGVAGCGMTVSRPGGRGTNRVRNRVEEGRDSAEQSAG